MGEPHLRQFGSSRPHAAVLVLHGGRERGTSAVPPWSLAYARMIPFARDLARQPSLAVFQLRYRVRGWNAPALDPVVDARWALDAIRRQFDVPVGLVGHSMGGRVAFRVADDPAVTAVCALAPWCPPSDPVAQLTERTVFIAHGTADRTTNPRDSQAYAKRAADVAASVELRWVEGEGHAMLRKPALWRDLVRQFVLGTLVS